MLPARDASCLQFYNDGYVPIPGGMSGHEALPALRAIQSSVPVIVPSGHSKVETHSEGVSGSGAGAVS